MRARRIRREAVIPTYELILSSEEEAHATTKTLENVEIGSQIMLKCTMAQEQEFEKMVFRAKSSDIGESSGSSSKSYQIDKYGKEHSGIYECGATRKKDGKYHSRQMRVTHKREKNIEPDLPSCPPEDANYCYHGECFLDGNRKICDCDDGFMGETCEKVLISAYDVKMLKVVGGTTGSLNVVCIIITIIFILLFCRERTAKMKLRRQVGQIQNIMVDHECSVSASPAPEAQHKVQITENQISRSSDGFARNSVRKMRLAFNRARLNGTSDSKLIEK